MPRVIIPIYLARTAFMNSTRFLMTSVLMDYVPKQDRGKWVGVDLFTGFGWSGSAVAGGYIIRECVCQHCLHSLVYRVFLELELTVYAILLFIWSARLVHL
jgi:hypothetical protein